MATGLQSSMEHVLNQHLQDKKDIHVAVGIDLGKTLVTNTGNDSRNGDEPPLEEQ